MAYARIDVSSMKNSGRNIIVIGASAGGLDALDILIAQLPTDLPASIFIVQHLAPENTGDAILNRLGKYRSFEAKLANDGEVFENSRIYIGRPDYHMLVKKDKLLVTKGARENRFRPGIDPLFRSAAVSHGPHVIGVVLTGMLDDGTAGLIAIGKCGGITVAQDPKDAAYPDMPQSAVDNLKIDYVIEVARMGQLLEKLTHERAGEAKPVPEDIRVEAEIAERVLSDVAQVSTLGPQVPYNCPNCGGVLWEIKKVGHAGHKGYRCHTGHSFTASTLLVSQSERIEETLWISLRMFEERKNLLNKMAQTENAPTIKKSYIDRAKETETHIERIRAMLMAPKAASEK
jgi:two-component system chemotaxis response regulator CheB